MKYNKILRDRYSIIDIVNSFNKDKFSGDAKDNSFGFLETCRK